jgi:hypothetical protein
VATVVRQLERLDAVEEFELHAAGREDAVDRGELRGCESVVTLLWLVSAVVPW